MPGLTLSVDGRNLLNRTIDWFEADEARWIHGSWGTAVNSDGDELELEKEGLLSESWKGYESEREEYDEIKKFWNYEVTKPWVDSRIKNACAVGGLIVCNNFQDDGVLQEVLSFLAENVEDDYKYIDENGVSTDTAENIVVNFNDSGKSREAVLDLFRRTARS